MSISKYLRELWWRELYVVDVQWKQKYCSDKTKLHNCRLAIVPCVGMYLHPAEQQSTVF